MTESEYHYKIIKTGKEDKIDLGEYKQKVIALYSEFNPDIRVDPQAEVESGTEKTWLAVILALKDADNVVGYSVLSKHHSWSKIQELELSQAYVKREHRRRGIYKEFVKKRIEIANEFGFPFVYVHPLATSPQRRFLRNEGFQRVRTRNGSIYRKQL